MTSKQDVVIVETPFQLLCAYEYIHQHRTNPFFVLRTSGVGRNDQQLHAMIKDLDLKVSMELNVSPASKIDTLVAALKIATRSFPKRERVVLGSYFSRIQRLLSNLIRNKEIVLLDDGVATIYADKLIKQEAHRRYSTFSIFPLDPTHYLRTELNEFKSLTSRYKCANNEDFSAFFIGQKLVDIGALSLDAYLKTIKCAVNIAHPSVLYYIPHRATSRECIAQVQEISGVKIIQPDYAIEYFLLKARIYPKRIFSIISTAVYSLATMFPASEIICFKPAGLRSEIFPHYELVINAFLSHPQGITFREID